MTESGTPIPDVGVDLNGGFDGQGLYTDAEGWARFSNLNAGDAASVHTFARGFHDAGRRFVIEPLQGHGPERHPDAYDRGDPCRPGHARLALRRRAQTNSRR